MSGCHGKKFSLKILVKIDVRVPRDKKFSRAPGHGFFPKFENDENDENSSIRSENVMVKLKKFTVGSALNSGTALLLISHLGNVFKTGHVVKGQLACINLSC